MTGDPGDISWLRLVLAFSVVIALMAGLAFALKYMKARGLVIPGLNPLGSSTRMEIVESLALDMRRRLVIVRCDGTEHLLLLGPETETVVDTRIGTNQLSSPTADKPSVRVLHQHS